MLAKARWPSVRKFHCGIPCGQGAHILLIPELMQLLMGISMSWMVDPAGTDGGIRRVCQADLGNMLTAGGED